MSGDATTTRRDFLDPVFKEVMALNFAQLSLAVETQVEVSRLLTKEILEMAGKQSLYEKQLQRIVESMGADLLKTMTPEERMDGLTVSERVQDLTVDERVQGLTVDERLAGLSEEDLQNLDPDVKRTLLLLVDTSNGTQQE